MTRFTCKYCKRSLHKSAWWGDGPYSCGRCERKLREARHRRRAARKLYRGF